MTQNFRRSAATAFALGLVAILAMCDSDDLLGPEFDRPVDPQLAAEGREIFRFDTFANEVFWSDTVRLHEVIQQAVSPRAALQVGLKVDAEALPQAVRNAIQAGQVDLDDPATTLALPKLDAVVGLERTVGAGRLHAPAETGMEPVYASRSITKMYRTTPLRGLWRPPQLQGPYFHDGSAATLEEVVEHYNRVRNINLSAQQQRDLVEFLKFL